jgi:hypothetical protein
MGVGGRRHIWAALTSGTETETHCAGDAQCLRMNCFYTSRMVSLDVAHCNQNKGIITPPLLFSQAWHFFLLS